MKLFVLAITSLLIAASSFGQGRVSFRSRAPDFDILSVLASNPEIGAGTIPGMKAQLFLVENGSLTAVSVAAPFLASSGLAAKYFEGSDVVLPRAGPVTLRIRVYDGATFEGSLYWGESADVTLAAPEPPEPPPLLHGLNGSEILVVPEPGPRTLLAAGAALWAILRFLKRG